MGRALAATDLDERSRLIDEAIYWRNLTADAAATSAVDDIHALLVSLERGDPG